MAACCWQKAAITLFLVSVVLGAPAWKARRSSSFVPSVKTDGSYSISVGGKTWLPSAATYFYADRAKYSSEDGTLKLVQTSTSSGVNGKLGEWQSTDFLYHAGYNEITASIKTFANINALFFSQYYKNPTTGTTSGNVSSVSSAFPSFRISVDSGDIGYLSYGGSFLGTSIILGQWKNSTAYIRDGVGGGPLLLFDHDHNVIIISSFSEFMAASMYHNGDVISWGIMGGVNDIPAMYESSFIVYYSDKGVNGAMKEWGELMRFYYGKDRSFRDADLIVNYLGFWTDDGAYYFKDTTHNKTYQDIILDIKAYSLEKKIPYRYIQYDNWWYRKGAYDGVVTWEPVPGIFPDGMEYVYNKTGWPVIAQNKWWSVNTTYAKQNGGKYDFIIDTQKAIPNDTTFWPEFLHATKRWGLITYEQDWLDIEFGGLNVTLKTVHMGRDWLMQMGKGAAENDLKIQYCMPNPRHGLQALEISVVTHCRVSGDYIPGNDQWRIGITSILADALGLAPFKDNFWTSPVEPGSIYHANATHPALEAVVATLSTGPVGPSDMVGKTNVDLLMRCCNADGLILKPSMPARSIDANILQRAFHDDSGPDGEVWSTVSEIEDFIFGTILAPNQTKPYQLTPSDAWFGVEFPPSVVYKHTWPNFGAAANFSMESPLTISDCIPSDPCLWHTSPVINFRSSNVFFYGEMEKWVPMSPKRVTNIDMSDDIYVTVVGAVEEIVNFSFGVESSSVTTISCNLGLSGSAIIGLMAKSCRSL